MPEPSSAEAFSHRRVRPNTGQTYVLATRQHCAFSSTAPPDYMSNSVDYGGHEAALRAWRYSERIVSPPLLAAAATDVPALQKSRAEPPDPTHGLDKHPPLSGSSV